MLLRGHWRALLSTFGSDVGGGGVVPPPPAAPALDFSRASNSMYYFLLFLW